MRAWVASFLPLVVLAAAFSCSNDQGSSQRDAGPAHADAGASHTGGGAHSDGSPGAVSSSGGTKSGFGGHDASIGDESKDGAEGSAGEASSSDEGGKDASSEVPEAGTPVRGVIQGTPFEGVDDYSIVTNLDGVSYLRVEIAPYADACGTQLSILRTGTFHKSSRGLYLAVSVPGSSVPPGAYHVNATIILDPSRFQTMVWGGYAHNDDQCAEQYLDSLSGTVLIREVTDQHVTGAFDIKFYDGQHVSGAFDAARCDQLLNPGHSDSGTPGCFP
ncbi:MAG TPA: hypothetical protein VHC69_25935 [Polyangiaceae bacterium]|nr:hypothetical protein [Polyangiaceae bacterium]